MALAGQRRRCELLSTICLYLALLVDAQGAARSATPSDAPPSVRALVGEYRAPMQTITLLELNSRLYLREPTADAIAVHKRDASVYSADDGRQLTLTGKGSFTWNGMAFECYDLGLERVALIRSRARADASALRAAAFTSHPPAESLKLRTPDLVPLLGTVPRVKLDIKYATSDNFIGMPLYGSAVAFLQRPAATALAAVARSLAQQGLGLVIFDGYRPWFVTKMFWDAVPPDAHVFVANPSEGSKHNRGCAVDLSLYDLKSGRPIEMTSRYDEMSPRSYAHYEGGTTRERWYRDLLRQEMQARGFEVYPQEWWHFDYRDWQLYPIGNQAFENIQTMTRE